MAADGDLDRLLPLRRAVDVRPERLDGRRRIGLVALAGGVTGGARTPGVVVGHARLAMGPALPTGQVDVRPGHDDIGKRHAQVVLTGRHDRQDMASIGSQVNDRRRLALVIGSQCEALPALSFLPKTPGPVDVSKLEGNERLAVELRDLLVDGPGECDPVRDGIEGLSAPGLLLNPTAAQAHDALIAALRAGHKAEAVLVVHVLAHGSGYQPDPAKPVRHLLHLWDTVKQPVDTEPESRAWDPYRDIDARRPHTQQLAGLVLVVDACQASWAKAGIEGWSGVREGLLSAVLAASGDESAWDACLTRTLVDVLRTGLSATQHNRRTLVAELLAADVEPVAAGRCRSQTPRVDGYQSHNPVLFLGRNIAADDLARRLGLDGGTAGLVLRLTRHYVEHAVAPVVSAVEANRLLAILGEAGTGKSTLAAALRSPPVDSNVPIGLVNAAAFVSAAPGVTELAHSLASQLRELPGYEQAAARFERDNRDRWDALDLWQRELIGPLGLFHQPVRLLVDGIDQLGGGVHDAAVRRSLTELVEQVPHVSLVVTSRADPDLAGSATVLMPALDDEAARRYLTARGVDVDRHDALVALAAGRWLVLDLAAGMAGAQAERVARRPLRRDHRSGQGSVRAAGRRRARPFGRRRRRARAPHGRAGGGPPAVARVRPGHALPRSWRRRLVPRARSDSARYANGPRRRIPPDPRRPPRDARRPVGRPPGHRRSPRRARPEPRPQGLRQQPSAGLRVRGPAPTLVGSRSTRPHHYEP